MLSIYSIIAMVFTCDFDYIEQKPRCPYTPIAGASFQNRIMNILSIHHLDITHRDYLYTKGVVLDNYTYHERDSYNKLKENTPQTMKIASR